MARKFLVVADDSPEFETALRYAARRARSTGGRVALLRVIGRGGSDAHWSGIRDEIDRQMREEAEALLMRVGEEAAARSGAQPLFLIEEGEPEAAIRKVVAEDPEIRVLILAVGTGGRGPGPLVGALLKQGSLGSLKLPVTLVPGELTEADIEDQA